MAIVDPNLEFARRAREGMRSPALTTLADALGKTRPLGSSYMPQVSQSGLALAKLQQDARMGFQDAERRRQAALVASGKQAQADQGGIGGFLGDIMDSAPAKILMAPLTALDVPRRVVLSTVKEVGDLLEGWTGGEKGKASFGDWFDQVKDPSFGFGRVIGDITDNSGVNRLLGFIGDVAFDPLTYVTLGASKFAGASGRMALAEQVLNKTGDEVLAQAVIRSGRAALTTAQISEYAIPGLKARGMYFMGKKIGKNGYVGRVSETLGGMGEKAINRLRFAADDFRITKFLQTAFTPETLKEAKLALLRGEFNAPGLAGDVIRVLNSRNIKRSFEGLTLTTAQRDLVQLVQNANLAENAVLRRRVTGILEKTILDATPEEQAVADAITQLKLKWFKDVRDSMHAVDPTARIGYVEDHVPWMLSDAGKEHLDNPTSRWQGEISKGFDDGDLLSVFSPRWLADKIKRDGRAVWFGRELTTDDLDNLSIDFLNRVAREGGADFDVFETDIIKIMNKYSHQYAMQMGLAKQYDLLAKSGVMARREALGEADELYDPKVAEELAKEVEKRHKTVVKSSAELDQIMSKTKEAVAAAKASIEERLAKASSMDPVVDAWSKQQAMFAVVNDILEPIKQRLRTLRTATEHFGEVFTNDVPTLQRELNDAIINLEAELKQIADQVTTQLDNQANLGFVRSNVDTLLTQIEQFAAERMTVLRQVTAEFDLAARYGHLIESRWDDIERGVTFVVQEGFSPDQAAYLEALAASARGDIQLGGRSRTEVLREYAKRIRRGQKLTETSAVVKSGKVSKKEMEFINTFIDELQKNRDLFSRKGLLDRVIAGESFAAGEGLTRQEADQLNEFVKALKATGIGDAPRKGRVRGRFAEYVASTHGLSREEWMWKAQGSLPLSLNRISKLTVQDIEDLLQRSAVAGAESLNDLRTVAVWMLAQDYHLHGGQVPDFLRAHFDALVSQLEEASAAQFRYQTVRDLMTGRGGERRRFADIGSEAIPQIQKVEKARDADLVDRAIQAGWADGVWNADAAAKEIGFDNYVQRMARIQKARLEYQGVPFKSAGYDPESARLTGIMDRASKAFERQLKDRGDDDVRRVLLDAGKRRSKRAEQIFTVASKKGEKGHIVGTLSDFVDDAGRLKGIPTSRSLSRQGRAAAKGLGFMGREGEAAALYVSEDAFNATLNDLLALEDARDRAFALRAFIAGWADGGNFDGTKALNSFADPNLYDPAFPNAVLVQNPSSVHETAVVAGNQRGAALLAKARANGIDDPKQLQALVQAEVKKARQELKSLLRSESYTLTTGDTMTTGRLRTFLKDDGSGDLVMSSAEWRQFSAQQIEEQGASRAIAEANDADAIAKKMLHALESYRVMSLYNLRWNRLVAESAALGFVPTERQAKRVFDGIARSAVERWQRHAEYNSRAIELLNQIEVRWREIFQASKSANYGEALKQAWTEVSNLKGLDDSMHTGAFEILDRLAMRWGEPRGMAERMTKDFWKRKYPYADDAKLEELVNQVWEHEVKPWVDRYYPNVKGRGAAAKKLKQMAKGGDRRSVFHGSAKLRDIEEFFVAMRGGDLPTARFDLQTVDKRFGSPTTYTNSGNMEWTKNYPNEAAIPSARRQSYLRGQTRTSTQLRKGDAAPMTRVIGMLSEELSNAQQIMRTYQIAMDPAATWQHVMEAMATGAAKRGRARTMFRGNTPTTFADVLDSVAEQLGGEAVKIRNIFNEAQTAWNVLFAGKEVADAIDDAISDVLRGVYNGPRVVAAADAGAAGVEARGRFVDAIIQAFKADPNLGALPEREYLDVLVDQFDDVAVAIEQQMRSRGIDRTAALATGEVQRAERLASVLAAQRHISLVTEAFDFAKSKNLTRLAGYAEAYVNTSNRYIELVNEWISLRGNGFIDDLAPAVKTKLNKIEKQLQGLVTQNSKTLGFIKGAAGNGESLRFHAPDIFERLVASERAIPLASHDGLWRSGRITYGGEQLFDPYVPLAAAPPVGSLPQDVMGLPSVQLGQIIQQLKSRLVGQRGVKGTKELESAIKALVNFHTLMASDSGLVDATRDVYRQMGTVVSRSKGAIGADNVEAALTRANRMKATNAYAEAVAASERQQILEKLAQYDGWMAGVDTYVTSGNAVAASNADTLKPKLDAAEQEFKAALADERKAKQNYADRRAHYQKTESDYNAYEDAWQTGRKQPKQGVFANPHFAAYGDAGDALTTVGAELTAATERKKAAFAQYQTLKQQFDEAVASSGVTSDPLLAQQEAAGIIRSEGDTYVADGWLSAAPRAELTQLKQGESEWTQGAVQLGLRGRSDVRFTRGEWEILFATDDEVKKVATESRSTLSRLYAKRRSLQAEHDAVVQLGKDLKKRAKELVAEGRITVDEAEDWIAGQYKRNWKQIKSRTEAVNEAIPLLQDEIKGWEVQARNFGQYETAESRRALRRSAEEKLQKLMASPEVLTDEALSRTFRRGGYADEAAVAARRQRIGKIWEGTDQFKYLRKVDFVEKSARDSAMNKLLESRRNLIEYLSRIHVKAQLVRKKGTSLVGSLSDSVWQERLGKVAAHLDNLENMTTATLGAGTDRAGGFAWTQLTDDQIYELRRATTETIAQARQAADEIAQSIARGEEFDIDGIMDAFNLLINKLRQTEPPPLPIQLTGLDRTGSFDGVSLEMVRQQANEELDAIDQAAGSLASQVVGDAARQGDAELTRLSSREAVIHSDLQMLKSLFDSEIEDPVSDLSQALAFGTEGAVTKQPKRANTSSVGKMYAFPGTKSKKTLKTVYGVQDIQDVFDMYDTALAGVSNAVMSRQQQVEVLARELEDITNLMNDLEGVGRVVTVGSGGEDALYAEFASIARSGLNTLAALEDPALAPLAGHLLAGVQGEAKFFRNRAANADAIVQLGNMGNAAAGIKQSVDKAAAVHLVTLEGLGLPGMQAREEIKNILSRMARLEEPKFARLVNGLIGKYTKFFRAYATLSPGFHLRNSISNISMLLASGADPTALATGWKLWSDWQEAFKVGRTFEEWLLTVPEQHRYAAEIAGRTMYGMGGGQTADLLNDAVREGGKKLMNNKALRASRKVGGLVEGSARFMLAFDAGMTGMDLNGAMARVRRYLFDYNDLSAADRNMKAIVPFWTWMSRNLPLQMINQWTHPRLYQVYASMTRNIRSDEQGVAPPWLAAAGAIPIGGDKYLNLDLGWNKIQETVGQVKDPMKLLSNLNPGIRVPIEVMGGTQFFTGNQFSSTPQQATGGPASGIMQQFAELLGLGSTAGPNGVMTQDGRRIAGPGEGVVDPRFNYAIQNMIPPLGQATRLFPSSDAGDRGINSWLSYLGIPLTEVTPDMQSAEIARRQRELQRLQASASRLGYTP